MTPALEQAIDEVSSLPPEAQDAFAAWIVAELHAEQQWARAFAQSPDLLASLADAALGGHRAGKTQPLDDASF